MISIIDAHGRPLAWKFSRQRNMQIYYNLIHSIKEKLPVKPIFIGDGWNVYQKTCLRLAKDCFLIEHLHFHPWQVVRLHQFQFDSNTKTTIQNSIEIPYNPFIQNNVVTGFAFQRKHVHKNPTVIPKRKGRPFGSRDKEKRHSKYHLHPTVSKPPLKRRGRKSIRENGFSFQFHPQPIPVGWQVEWRSEVPVPQFKTRLQIVDVELLLDIIYKVMRGKFIQSNRIESFNRVIKDITPKKGFKHPIQLTQHLDRFLRFWSNTNSLSDFKGIPITPLKASIGFARLLSFFQPRIESLQISRD